MRTPLSAAVVAFATLIPSAAGQSYARYSSYWTTSGGYVSSIKLHNHHLQRSLAIQPTLFLADGTPVPLSNIQLAPLANSEIDVSAELRRRNLPDGNGSAVFRYVGPARDVLAAETLITNTRFSLAYTIPSYEQRHASTVQHYLFWRPSGHADIYVALQNTTDSNLVVRPSIQLQGRMFPLSPVSLAPHGQRLLDFPDTLTGESQMVFAGTLSGGIVFDYTGAPANGLNTSGWVEDRNLGFSTMLSFHDAAENPSTNLLGNQILLKNFVDGTPLSTQLLLWNTGATTSMVDLRFVYQHGSQVMTARVPVQPLNANELRAVDLSDAGRSGLIPGDITEGVISATFTGANGQVMGRVFATSVDGSYGYYWRLRGVALQATALGVYWTVEDGWDTRLSLTNPGDREDVFTVHLTYNGGLVSLPGVTLQPLQSATWSLREWLADGGKTGLPADVRSGGVRVTSGRLDARLLVEEYAIQRDDRLATPFYQFSPLVTDMTLAPNPVVVGVGSIATVTETVYYIDGTQAQMTISDQVSISDPNIATFASLNGKWQIGGKLPGQTTFSVTITSNTESPITREVTVTVPPPATVSIQRPIKLTTQPNSNQPLPFVGNLSAIGSDALGIYQWISSDPTTLAIDNPGSSATTFRVLQYPARVTITVKFFDSFGQPALDAATFVVTDDVTAVTDIDQPSLPGPPSPFDPLLKLNMDAGGPTCSFMFGTWFLAATSSSDVGVPPVVFASDRNFLNNYIFQKDGDSFNFASDLGSNPTAFLVAKRNFRVGQRFQAYFEIRTGTIVPSSVGYVNNIATAGATKDPCHVVSDAQPEVDSVANGAIFLSPQANTISQVSGARVAFPGQAVDTYLNDRRLVAPLCKPVLPVNCFGPVGQTTPWIWNQVEFDLNGNLVGPIFGSHTSIFSMPWYTREASASPVYIVDFRSRAGQSLQQFIDNDVTYRFTIPAGAIRLQ